MPKLYILFFTIFCLLFNLSCTNTETEQKGLKSGSKVAVMSNDGHFLCADRNQDNQVFANRLKHGNWETFTVHLLKNKQIALQSSDFTFIGSNPAKQGQITAGFHEADHNTLFTLYDNDSGTVSLQDHNKKFLGFGPNQTLVANENSPEKAAQFKIQTIPEKGFSYFTNEQLLPLITGLVFLLLSLVLFQYKENKTLSIALLLLGGFCLRLFVALLNNYLTLWDEQFHALVAKNMMDHPFHPMLYKTPVLPYDASNWTSNHIWLHKQPLFLWQMALSMKLFGTNLFGLRFPSVLLSSLVVYLIYKIGSLSSTKTIGFYGALLFALSNFALELTSGTVHTDHNDVAFLFYVVASVWAWVEYEHAESSRKKYYLLLIGLFSGCAVLVKWLTGFLVFSGWGLSVLFIKERRTDWRRYVHLGLSFLIALSVFLPWQLYILKAFPVESRHEYSLNSKHFSEVVEGHGGDFFWHFNAAETLYGIHAIVLGVCVVVLLFSLNNKVFKLAFLSYIVLVYVFFGIAATKMVAFTYSVSFLIYLAMGAVLVKFFEWLVLNPVHFPKKTHTVIYTTLVLASILALNLDIEKIQEQHTLFKKGEDSQLAQKIRSIPSIKQLPEKIESIRNTVLLNCPPDDCVPIMFFTEVVAAYAQVPDSLNCTAIKKQGYQLAVFESAELPSHLKNDTSVIRIPKY